MFAPSVAFVDLETTGTTARDDRVTEIGIVRVDEAGRVSEWDTLVNPGCSIPSEIQALTGITNAMVATAPAFAAIAHEVAARIAGCVFVAHNARFDYGFLKHEFGRLGQAFSAKVLCTVKLSRRIDAEAPRHNLDSVVERYQLPGADRHRALGDARLLWEFARALYRRHPAHVIDTAVRRILRTPSLPPQLAPDALDHVPESPGVYRFYGLNALPLYVGKSINLRERIAAHFSSDYRTANDIRLSTEITRIEFDETAGELGALLHESRLIKRLLPSHNQRLRRRDGMVALRVSECPGPPTFVCSDAIDPAAMQDLYGPFTSRQSAREALRNAAATGRLCWSALGLERRVGACFARQIHRCAGACVGAERKETHQARVREVLSPYAMRPWPYRGMVVVREVDLTGRRADHHLFRDWCWLDSVQEPGALQALLACPPRGEFDLDTYRVLVKHLQRHRVTEIEPRAPAQIVWAGMDVTALNASAASDGASA